MMKLEKFPPRPDDECLGFSLPDCSQKHSGGKQSAILGRNVHSNPEMVQVGRIQ
jgi:hypothetical protein